MHLLNFHVFAANSTMAFGNGIGDVACEVEGHIVEEIDMYPQAMALLTGTCTWG